MAYSSDSIAWLAIKKQVQKQQARFRKRLSDMKEARKDRAGRRDTSMANAEAMQCPACKTKYAFGNECPDCAVPLVGDAFSEVAHSAQTDSYHKSFDPGLVVFLAVAFTLFIGIVSFFA